jgi:hypothetical protein
MGLIGAPQSAAACVPAGERVEMEPRLGARVTDRLEAAAALGAGDWRSTPVANGDERADLGLRGVDHLGSRLSDQGGDRGRVGEEILAPVVSRL